MSPELASALVALVVAVTQWLQARRLTREHVKTRRVIVSTERRNGDEPQ